MPSRRRPVRPATCHRTGQRQPARARGQLRAQHSGSMGRGTPQLMVSVVPIRHRRLVACPPTADPHQRRRHFYDFDYTCPDRRGDALVPLHLAAGAEAFCARWPRAQRTATGGADRRSPRAQANAAAAERGVRAGLKRATALALAGTCNSPTAPAARSRGLQAVAHAALPSNRRSPARDRPCSRVQSSLVCSVVCPRCTNAWQRCGPAGHRVQFPPRRPPAARVAAGGIRRTCWPGTVKTCRWPACHPVEAAAQLLTRPRCGAGSGPRTLGKRCKAWAENLSTCACCRFRRGAAFWGRPAGSARPGVEQPDPCVGRGGAGFRKSARTVSLAPKPPSRCSTAPTCCWPGWSPGRGPAVAGVLLHLVHVARTPAPDTAARRTGHRTCRTGAGHRTPAIAAARTPGRLELAAPTLELQLSCRQVVAAAAPTVNFSDPGQRRARPLRLIERLRARLGEEQVQRLVAVADHRPERASIAVPCHAVTPTAVPPPVAQIRPEPPGVADARPVPLANVMRAAAAGRPLQAGSAPRTHRIRLVGRRPDRRDSTSPRPSRIVVWVYRSRLMAGPAR